jgi:hypothetical protein
MLPSSHPTAHEVLSLVPRRIPENVMKRLLRLVRITGLALLLVWAIYAPLFAYTRGHLIGYRDGVADTLTKIVKAWPLVPMQDRSSKPL